MTMAVDRLRILLLVDAGGAAAGRHVLNLAGGLAEQEHEVHLLYSPARVDAGFARSLQGLDPRVRVAQLPLRRFPHWTGCAAVRRLRRYLRVHGAFQVLHAYGAGARRLARLAGPGMADVCLFTPPAPGSVSRARALTAWALQCLLPRFDGMVTVQPESDAPARRMVAAYRRALSPGRPAGSSPARQKIPLPVPPRPHVFSAFRR